MPEDVFRIVITVAVALAAIAFVAQAATMAALSRAVRKMQEKTESLMDQAEPIIAQLGPAIEKVQALTGKAGPVLEKAGLAFQQVGPAFEKVGIFLDEAVPAFKKAGPVVDRAGKIMETAQQMLEENRPSIAGISSDVAGIVRTGREEVERLGELLHEAGDRARARLDQIEGAVDSTIEQVEQAGGAVKRAVLRPVREANGIAAGISAAVSTLMRGRKSSVDSATQDEEMFI